MAVAVLDSGVAYEDYTDPRTGQVVPQGPRLGRHDVPARLRLRERRRPPERRRVPRHARGLDDRRGHEQRHRRGRARLRLRDHAGQGARPGRRGAPSSTWPRASTTPSEYTEGGDEAGEGHQPEPGQRGLQPDGEERDRPRLLRRRAGRGRGRELREGHRRVPRQPSRTSLGGRRPRRAQGEGLLLEHRARTSTSWRRAATATATTTRTACGDCVFQQMPDPDFVEHRPPRPVLLLRPRRHEHGDAARGGGGGAALLPGLHRPRRGARGARADGASGSAGRPPTAATTRTATASSGPRRPCRGSASTSARRSRRGDAMTTRAESPPRRLRPPRPSPRRPRRRARSRSRPRPATSRWPPRTRPPPSSTRRGGRHLRRRRALHVLARGVRLGRRPDVLEGGRARLRRRRRAPPSRSSASRSRSALTPIFATVGYRFRNGKLIVPYAAGGRLDHLATRRRATSPARPSTTTARRRASSARPGVEVGRGTFRFGAEVGYSAVPDALGLGGVSKVYGEDDLGGTYAIGKLIVAF